MIDLSPHHLETVQRILAEHLPDYEVRAFGSRATWTAWEYSDLDLAVVSPEPLDRRTSANLREAFEESDLPIRVDVVEWTTLTDGFRQAIEGDLVVLQQASRSSDWRKTTIGECAVVNESSYSPKEEWPFINYLDTGNITANRISDIQRLVSGESKIPSRARRKVQSGDIVYSTVRPDQRHYGIIKEPPDNFLASTGFAVLSGREGIAETDFLYWFLTQDHIVEYLHSIAENSTSAYPSMKPRDLERLPISLPPLDEQRRITGILGALDDKIELNRRMSHTLEDMAQALFKSWFIDFDPVRAKAAGRETGLPPTLDALFPSSFQPSELGEIPSGWEGGSLGDVIDIHDRARIPLNRRQRTEHSGPYPYYGAAGIMDHVDAFLFNGVFVLVGEDGSVVDDLGHPVTQYVWGKFWVNNHAHVLKGNDGTSEEFLYLFLLQLDVLPFVTGAVQPKLNQRNLKDIELRLPPGRISAAFDRLVQPMFAQLRALNDESAHVVSQRDTLLTELLPGTVS